MSNLVTTATANVIPGVTAGFQMQVPTVVKVVGSSGGGGGGGGGGGSCRPCSTGSVGSGQSWNGNTRCDDDGEDSMLLLDDYCCGGGGGGDDSTRGPSPDPDSSAAGGLGSMEARSRSRHNLQVPSEHYGFFGSGRKSITRLSETLFEEESDLIRSCGALSTVLGLRKSFSTSDITQSNRGGGQFSDPLKTSSSELTLCGGLLGGVRDDFVLSTHMVGCLDYTSRSCSTWVAVGDMASTSQLPSPQGNPPSGGQLTDSPPVMLAAEFIRSVNKKVRQTYIKRRLLTTYKALERIAQSELNLQVCGTGTGKGGSSVANTNRASDLGGNSGGGGTGPWAALVGQKVSKSQVSREILKLLRRDFDPQRSGGFGLLTAAAAAKNLSLTAKDVENEKGKPLSKFERNMIIFNWLHTLGDHAYDRLA